MRGFVSVIDIRRHRVVNKHFVMRHSRRSCKVSAGISESETVTKWLFKVVEVEGIVETKRPPAILTGGQKRHNLTCLMLCEKVIKR